MIEPFSPVVITPCFKEDPEILLKCHQSVLSQTVPCTHVFVADGSDTDMPVSDRSIHLRLPLNSSDNGNTPRSIGSVFAIARGFEPVFLLDADNWYSSDHVETALRLKLENPDLDVVFSSRYIVLDDGTRFHPAPEDQRELFADTSTMCFFQSAFTILPLFAFIPPKLSPICDRIIYSAIRSVGLKAGSTGKPSLYFKSHYRAHYLYAKKLPTEELHDPDWSHIKSILPLELSKFKAKTGITVDPYL